MMTGMVMQRTLEDRLMSRCVPEPNTGCLLWLGAACSSGYGQIRVGTKHEPRIGTHVAAWEIANRQMVPPGLFVCHKCDVRLCCNPQHLFLGTHKDNMADMRSKGRQRAPRGEARPNSILTETDVLSIREAYAGGGVFQRHLAESYGVSEPTIQAVVSRRTWRHLP